MPHSARRKSEKSAHKVAKLEEFDNQQKQNSLLQQNHTPERRKHSMKEANDLAGNVGDKSKDKFLKFKR